VDADAGGGGGIEQEYIHRRDAETQRKTKKGTSKRAQRRQRAQRKHFSLILCVSAVIIRFWRNPERPI
jgi:hypothetical protein